MLGRLKAGGGGRRGQGGWMTSLTNGRESEQAPETEKDREA